MKKLLYILFLVSTLASAQDTLVLNTKLPFPTAYGPGAVSSTTGGGTGTLVFVDNLSSDQGTTGSYKWAANQSSPKRIIPNVSGRVSYSSQYKDGRAQEEADDVTIYGHLAPQGGLEMYSGGMYYEYVKNVIWRGVKARGRVADGDNITLDRGENIIVDHCSTAYSSGGESIDVSGNTSTPYSNGDITVSFNLLAQSRNGVIMGDSGGSNSDGNMVLGNIFVNVGWRFPKFGGSIDLDVYLNGVHNWTNRMMRGDAYEYTVNEISNYYQKGLNSKNRPNDNLHKSYTKSSAPYPQIWTDGNIITDSPPTGYPADQRQAWQQVASPPIGFNDATLQANHFASSKNTRTWREFPELHSDSVRTMILNRAGATYFVDDVGNRGRYYDDTDQDAYDTFLNDTQEDNSSSTYQNSNIPTNTRGAGYDTDNDGLPQWFETAHSVSTTDEVKTYWTFTHYDTGATYVVQNDAGYGALDIFSSWVIQDFEFLLDLGEVAGDTTYSINAGSGGGTVAVNTLTWDNDTQTVDENGTLDLSYTFDPSNATDQGFSLSSSNTGVVSNTGAVVGVGTATLTITADDTTNSASDDMSVTITAASVSGKAIRGKVKTSEGWVKIKN